MNAPPGPNYDGKHSDEFHFPLALLLKHLVRIVFVLVYWRIFIVCLVFELEAGVNVA